MAGLISLKAEFVLEDSIWPDRPGGGSTKVLGLRIVLQSEAAGHLMEVCGSMSRMMIREAVANTNMLAQIATHPADLENDDDPTLT